MTEHSKTTVYTKEELCSKIMEQFQYVENELLLDIYKKVYNKGYKDFEITKEGLFKVIEYAPITKGEGDHIIVGAYYEKPDNKIVYIYGANSPKREVRYYNSKNEHSIASYKDVKDWVLRRDLNDFPDTNDPKVPYVFDLFWDFKRESDLLTALNEGHEDSDYIKQLIHEHEIKNLYWVCR